MAESITLARPYAKAAFEYARSHNTLGRWSSSLALISSIVQHSRVEQLLDSPTVVPADKVKALLGICDQEIDQSIKNFVTILAENKRLLLMQEVQQLFEMFKSQQEKFSYITVSSAFEINADMESKLTQKLSTLLESEVNLSVEIDKSLIGGVVVRAGDTVIDGSVRGRLAKLADTIGLN